MSVRKWLYHNWYLKTRYWKWERRHVAQRAGWHCEVDRCTEAGPHLQAHHTSYKILFREWLFPDKMIYLCEAHHQATHDGKTLKIRGGKTLEPFHY
jgi:hypothetical protein